MRNRASWIFYVLATLLIACSGSGSGKQSKKHDDAGSVTLSAGDSIQIMADLAFLSSKECEGRRPGTPGHQKAFERVLSRLRSTGVDTLNGSMIQTFTGRSLQGFTEGKNAIGWIRGGKYPDQYIVLSAHYDHMGKRGDSVWFAGADDNASGTAAALAIAGYLKKNTPDYSVIIAILDREETGLEGARAIVPYLKQILGDSAIKFNVNMDMVARSDNNELYVVGGSFYPKIAEWVSSVQQKTNVKLLMGHDGADGKQNWTTQSDHFAFHSAGIPFMYLGVEDHPDYHKVTDTFEKVNAGNYFSNCKAALELLKQVSF